MGVETIGVMRPFSCSVMRGCVGAIRHDADLKGVMALAWIESGAKSMGEFCKSCTPDVTPARAPLGLCHSRAASICGPSSLGRSEQERCSEIIAELSLSARTKLVAPLVQREGQR